MRKNIHIILSRLIQTCLVASLLAGCTKVVPDDSFEQKSRIGFNTAMTKAAVGYPIGSRFISTAYSIASTGSWDDAASRTSATKIIDEEEVSYIEAERYWSTSTEHYWNANRKYTFFSYSPSSLKGKVGVSKDGVTISNWDVETDATEILVADIAKDKTKNESFSGYSGVPTNFRQKLSKLSFKMGISQDAEADTKVTLLGIKIVDICTRGNYSRGGYTDDSWAVVESSRKTGTSEFTVFGSSQALSRETSFNPASKLIIPQSLLQSGSYHPQLIVEYQIQVGEGAVETKTAECYFDINLRQESWEKGMEYTYTIHIGVGQYPIEFDGTVDPWNVVNNGEVNIG
ncbi:MAG: fimbrillin family protein [Candidatus Cryptobacteroides sp.]|nr:fimbrillin family protein [Bacteroidales bacterium]MDY6159109.1 fimbrillin family protein [Candidatus Cryptobacteroides sp.]